MRGRSYIPALFRGRWMSVASVTVWTAFVLNFSALQLPDGDEQVQFTFVRRLFGDAHQAVGYYFGLGLLEAPFYALGKLFDQVGLHEVLRHPVEQTAIALGFGLVTLLAWPLLSSVASGLGLRYASLAVLAAAFGTPFFYYATFVPAKNHVPDALLFTAAVYLTFRYFRSETPERWVPYALGALYGLAYTVRYFNGAEAVALVLMLMCWRRWRHAAQVAATSAVTCGALFLIPAAVDVPVFSGGSYSAENVLVFAPLNPLRMLFTDHRGYFVWSPISILAAVGLIIFFRRRPEHRRFVMTTVAMGGALMASYALIAFWDGTWTFGQRFYTPLFPLVAIGFASLLDAAPRVALAAGAAAVAWSLFLVFNLTIIGGPQYLNTTTGGAHDLALVPLRTHTSVGAYAWGLWHKSNLRHLTDSVSR